MPILRVSHIGICVSDLERSLRFYRDQLGFQEASRIAVAGEPTDTLLQLEDVELEAVFLERDGTCIELLSFAKPRPSEGDSASPINRLGLTHLSLRVSELAALVDSLAAAGVQVVAASRIDNPQFGAHAVFIRDPDGTRIELLEASGDVERPPGA